MNSNSKKSEYPKYYDFVSNCQYYIGNKKRKQQIEEKYLMQSHRGDFAKDLMCIELYEKKILENNIDSIDEEFKYIDKKLGSECRNAFYELFVLQNTQEYVAKKHSQSNTAFKITLNNWRAEYEKI